MKIKITNIETGETNTYEFNRNNWAGRLAAMEQGRVIMWAPSHVGKVPIITSGRRWEIIE